MLYWVQFHNSTQLRIETVSIGRSKEANECALINDACDFIFNFDLKNMSDLRAVNALMCFWANSSLSNRSIGKINGRTVDLLDLDFTNKKDIKKLQL